MAGQLCVKRGEVYENRGEQHLHIEDSNDKLFQRQTI